MHTHYATPCNPPLRCPTIDEPPATAYLFHAQPRPRRDVAAAQPDKSRDKAEGAGAGPSSWEVPAKQLSACQTASQAMQQVRLYIYVSV